MTPPQAPSQQGTETSEENEMDWSYLVAGYNDVANYHNFGNYGSGFGPPPMGPTGANMPGLGPGMAGGVPGIGGMGMGPGGPPAGTHVIPPGGPPGPILRGPFGR